MSYKQACIQKHRSVEPLLSQTRVINLSAIPRLNLILLLIISCALGGAESHAPGVLLVSQARPNQPQRGSLSVSRTGKEGLVTLGRFLCATSRLARIDWLRAYRNMPLSSGSGQVCYPC